MSFFELVQHRHRALESMERITYCYACREPLDMKALNVITRVFEHGKCHLEAAWCETCQASLQGAVSEQSRANMELYGRGRLSAWMLDMEARQAYYDGPPRCLLTGEPLTWDGVFEFYTLVSHQVDSEQNYFFVGAVAQEQLQELLSEETRRSWEQTMEVIDPVMGSRAPATFLF